MVVSPDGLSRQNLEEGFNENVVVKWLLVQLTPQKST